MGRLLLALARVAELRRGEHGGAADTVAPGGGAEQHDRVAWAGGGAAHEPPARRETESHRVDEAVVLVGGLEVDLAADGGDADGVAVVPDPGDGSVEQVARACVSIPTDLAEAQRVEHGDRARADREDVAQDAPHAGGGSLERLDGAGVVVGLDLERAHEAPADVDGAGVLARAHHHVGALGGERAQELLGVLVGAVLAPHQRVHRELQLIWRPPARALLLAHERVLLARESERERVLDGGCWGVRVWLQALCRHHASAPSTARRIDWKIFSPSAEPPISSSTACSGWGIRPKTLPRSSQTPAMSRSEPLKLSPGA